MHAYFGATLLSHAEVESQVLDSQSSSTRFAGPLGASAAVMCVCCYAHVWPQLVSVRAPDLESCLLMLPFTDALRLLTYIRVWLDQGAGQHTELVSACWTQTRRWITVVFTLRSYLAQRLCGTVSVCVC